MKNEIEKIMETQIELGCMYMWGLEASGFPRMRVLFFEVLLVRVIVCGGWLVRSPQELGISGKRC